MSKADILAALDARGLDALRELEVVVMAADLSERDLDSIYDHALILAGDPQKSDPAVAALELAIDGYVQQNGQSVMHAPKPPSPKPSATSPVPDAPSVQPEPPDDGVPPVGEPASELPAGKPLIKSSAEFVKDFVPPDYMVDGLLRQACLYSLTGATGAGKTAITLRLAASVAEGTLFAGRETKKMRVLYLAAENPDDVRMRWIALAQNMGFDLDTIEVYWVEGCFKISKMAAKVRAEAEKRGGNFGLVVIDTGPVFYEGDDENSRTQQGKHAEMFRGLIEIIPGRPCVVVNCHPVKNAAADNLLPAGGGNFLNQVDGNLTAAINDSTTELHWQGKFRGVEFAPMHFLIQTKTHQDLKDSKGRLIPTVICEWINDERKEAIVEQSRKDEDKILALIDANPLATGPSLATAMGWKLHDGKPNKMRANRCVDGLKKDRLVKESRAGRLKLTPEGKKVLNGETEE